MNNKECMVFGSNEAGIHGAGAAFYAHKNHGAKWSVGIGLTGNSYAIPTKDKKIQTLPLEQVKLYVADFLLFVDQNPDMTFMVTKIGCGLAGFEVREIAPLFRSCLEKDNVKLPKDFLDFLCPDGYNQDKISFMW